MKEEKTLLPEEVAEAYARAWNNLDIACFEDMMSKKVSYLSQNVIQEIETRACVMMYLADLMKSAASSPDKRIFAEMGLTMPYDMYPKGGEPCVIMAQGDKDHIVGLVLFEIKHNEVSRIEFCTFVPDPKTAHRSGKYPE